MNVDHPHFTALCAACRVGDLKKVTQYVELEGVPVNRTDAFNSTPLYYASLCGHLQVVTYLLDHGATCDPNTFEGERALYGALTDEIKNVLKALGVSVAATDPFASDFAVAYFTLYKNAADRHADIVFAVSLTPEEIVLSGPGSDLRSSDWLKRGVREFSAHRSVLAARSDYFAAFLAGQWASMEVVPVKNRKVHSDIFGATLHYLYTGQVVRTVPEELWEDWSLMCRSFKLHQLDEMIHKELIGDVNGGKDEGKDIVVGRNIRRIQSDIRTLVRALVCFGNTWGLNQASPDDRAGRQARFSDTQMSVGEGQMDDSSSSSSDEVRVDIGSPLSRQRNGSPTSDELSAFAFIKAPLSNTKSARQLMHNPDGGLLEKALRYISASKPDIVLSIAGTLFPCHKAFLFRSPYFEAMLAPGVFAESLALTAEQNQKIGVIPITAVDDVDVFRVVLEHLYCEIPASTPSDHLTPDLALSVLEAADVLLLDRLKTQIAAYIVSETPAAVAPSSQEPIVASNLIPAQMNPESLLPPSPWDLMHEAWRLNLPRLEQHITRHFAVHLDYYLDKTNEAAAAQFAALITESAESTKNREETDTVVLVDDLRYWLAREHGINWETVTQGEWETYGETGGMSSAERIQADKAKVFWRRMKRLDAVLAEVGLDI
ncbi:hypothetical protein BJ742DRAFT_801490 [Cladochytrium replicatum]|nr:hypothetical protein BJ742DRAFT_801490 [Cladochytrium replicatum]